MANRKNEATIIPTKTIQVRVVDYPNGLRVYDNVQMARVISSKYNLLIMADHMPVIGEVDGDLEIVGENEIKTLNNIKAFYMNRANILSVLIKD